MKLWPFRKKWERLGRGLSQEELRRYAILSAGESFRFFPKDARYRAIPWDDFQSLMVRCLQPIPPYMEQKFDCDDIATCWEADIRRYWAARADCDEALACGQVLLSMKGGGRHVCGWQLDDQLTFRLVECYKRVGNSAPFTGVERIEQLDG